MTQPFQVEDLYLHQKPASLHCHPVLDHAVCSIKSVDRDKDSYVSNLWDFALDGSRRTQLTQGTDQNTEPRWSPDGSCIAFLSNRGGSQQVHLLPRDGGEARQVGAFPGSVTSVRWMPDGQSLVVTSAVTVDPDRRGRRSAEPPPERRARAEVAWRLPYKSDGIGYILSREIHLFAIDIDSGQHRPLSDGPFDVLGFDISHDGHIAYARSREGRFAHCYDLWLRSPDGRHRRLTWAHATVSQPLWSPDGRRIVFTGSQLEGDGQSRLWLVDVASGSVEQLGGDAVEVADPESVHWAADGRGVLFVRAHRGRHEIACIRPDDHQLSVLMGGDRQLGSFGCTDRRLVYRVDHPSLPADLWTASADGEHETRVTDLNPWWRDRTPIEAEARSFEVPDGLGGSETIEGWLLHAERQRPMPLLDDMHGGPASYALLDFDSSVFRQVLCSRGWAVLALNAVGSSSRGVEFCQRLAGHWGEYDLPQHLAAIRALQDEGVCDERVAVSGKSYGGYLSGWATGHTGQFKAAVVMAPVGNIETHYGTSDGGYYADPLYMGTPPRFDRELARRLSPLQYIERSTTPTLFLQGKDDERCPKCQAEELFVSLLRAGDTPAELVLYPDESHSFLGQGTPACREDAVRRIVDWLERHTVHAESPEAAPVEATSDA